MFFSSAIFKNSTLIENSLISEPFFSLVRSEITLENSIVSDISTSLDLYLISATERSKVSLKDSSLIDVSFSMSMLNANVVLSGL